MSNWAVYAIGIVYMGVGFDQLRKGNIPGFVTWFSYGTANFGLVHTLK